MSLYSSYTERGQHDETIRLLALAAKQRGAEDEELAFQVAEEAANNKASLRRIGAASLMALSTMALVATIASIAKVPQVHRNSDRTTSIDQSSKAMTRLASFLGGGHIDTSSSHPTASHHDELVDALSASTSSPKKVHVEIIAEAMCSNCKEHSYLFDEHIMLKGADLVDVLEIDMKMMVIDGWNTMLDKGECEKGRWDCELGKYQLAGWNFNAKASTAQKWTYSRCLFKYQPALIEHYVGSPFKLASSEDFMVEKVNDCALEAAFDADDIKSWVKTMGTKFLFDQYQHVKEFDDPVWIKVNGHYFEYEADWLAAICASYENADNIAACAASTNLKGVVASSTDTALDSGHVAENVRKEEERDGLEDNRNTWEEEEAAAQRDVATKSRELFTADNGKVNVYIVAEAFCPNCKEHSYYMDKLLMTPEGDKSGVRDIMNIYMEQMVLDGWDSEDETGICEKGKYDCELSKYNLCSEVIGNSIDNSDHHMWWDFVRCNYKHQNEILEMYKIKHVNERLISDITKTCAAESGVDYDTIKTCATGSMGIELLKGSYKRVSNMSMPVWIYVEGQKFSMHEDWLSAVCTAYHGKEAIPTECTGI